MIRSFGLKLAVLLSLVGASALVPGANLLQPRVYAAQGQSYTVYYYVTHANGRVTGPYVHGTFTSWASALRALHFLNSYPQIRAYVRTTL